MGAAGLQPFRIWIDALWRLASDHRGLALRLALVAFVALGFTALLSATSFYKNLNANFSDWAHNLVAAEERYSGVVLIDADQDSLDILAPSYGIWPYSRTAMAELIGYVKRAGAAVVVLHPQLELPAEDDAVLVAAFRSAGNVVLGASGVGTVLPRGRDFQLRLEALGWDGSPSAPGREWPELSMPLNKFTDPELNVNIGVHSVSVNKRDNSVRYLPLLHKARGQQLPSLALATLAAKMQTERRYVEYSHKNGSVSFNGRTWPVDEQGRVWPIVAANISRLPVIPMWQILIEAAGDRDAEYFADELRNRVVFIGSTAAVQGNSYNTPQGRVADLNLLANNYYALAHNRVLVPPKRSWNILLILLALVVPLITLRQNFQRLAMILTVSSLTGLAITLLFLALLLIGRQLTDPIYAYFVLGLVTTVLISFRAKYHVDEGKRLYYDKQVAESANQLKSEFLAQMTHELRTPLTSVIGFNRLLADGQSIEVDRGAYREIIHNNCQHLLQLINNILDHSKLVAGQMQIDPEVVDVPELMRQTCAGLMPLADEKGLEIRLEIDEYIPQRLLIDAFRFRQVLLNILGNALKFTDQGYISVVTDWDNGWLDVSIEDTGCGIPGAVLERVFDSFQQADVTISKNYGGTGLGLSISRDLVQLMGGRLGAESEVGIGSTFTVNVPAPYARPPERNLRELPIEPEMPVDLDRLAGSQLLVADDNPDIRALVKVFMKSASVAVHAVENGKEAVAYALTERPDLILMDMEMPVMDGYQAIALLRQRGFKAPIIGFTAHNSDEIQKTIKDLGADAIVRKPVAKNDLLNAVYRALMRTREPDSSDDSTRGTR